MSWPFVALSEICDLQNGYAFKSDDYVSSSNTLSCRMSNIRPGGEFNINYNARFLPDDFSKKYEQFLLRDGDVVIAMTDLADSPKILGVPTVIKTNGKNILLNQRVGKLVIKNSSKVFFPYLKLALNHPKVRSIYKRFAGGGLQINLGKADLLSVEIPLPPLSEQKRIAAILDKADTIRRKRQQAIQLADEFLSAEFLQRFGDPKDSPFGSKYLKDVTLKITDGAHFTPTYVDSGIPFLRVTDINKDTLDWSQVKYIPLEEHQELIKRCNPQKGDVLYSKNGTIGVPKLIDWDEKFSIFVSLCLIKPNPKYLRGRYLYSFLQTPFALKQATQKAKSATVTNLHLTEIKEIQLPVPSLSVQDEWINFVSNFSCMRGRLVKSQKQSDDAFGSISQKAFSGDL